MLFVGVVAALCSLFGLCIYIQCLAALLSGSCLPFVLSVGVPLCTSSLSVCAICFCGSVVMFTWFGVVLAVLGFSSF